ncbi:hypothetical protein SAMN03159293_00753 [Pseudomonas sp. NFACC39-1]|nr:hypothetical protein SAMN03159293_00753 [Pseudomonas sp. NFACC39-1]
MHVPETAVHKKCDFPLGKDNVGNSGQIFPMQSEAKASLEKHSTNKYLWFSVFASYSRHHSATDQCVDYISQSASGISSEGAENGRENIASLHSGRFAHSEIILPFAVS